MPILVGETDNPFSDSADDYARYTQLFNQLVKDEIQVMWNREKALFELVK